MIEEDEKVVAFFLADDAAQTALDSYKHPLADGWGRLEWRYLAQTQGRDTVKWLRTCFNWAVHRELIEVRRRNEIRIRRVVE